MYRLLITILSGCLAGCTVGLVQAQEVSAIEPPNVVEVEAVGEREDEIETDRDSFTPATTTAGCRRMIVEAAHSFIDNRSVPETHSYPELLVRWGIHERLEFRLGWNYEIGGAGSPISGNIPNDLPNEDALERESRVLYGFKSVVSQQDIWRPASAVIVHGFTPTSGEVTDSQLSATYVFGWTFPNAWVWDTAVRYGTGGVEEDHFNTWSPSTVVKVPIGERWKAHAEYFGVFTDGREDETVQHFFSPGAHYLISPDLELGVRVGWGLNHEAPNFFSNAGVGYRY